MLKNLETFELKLKEHKEEDFAKIKEEPAKIKEAKEEEVAKIKEEKEEELEQLEERFSKELKEALKHEKDLELEEFLKNNSNLKEMLMLQGLSVVMTGCSGGPIDGKGGEGSTRGGGNLQGRWERNNDGRKRGREEVELCVM